MGEARVEARQRGKRGKGEGGASSCRWQDGAAASQPSSEACGGRQALMIHRGCASALFPSLRKGRCDIVRMEHTGVVGSWSSSVTRCEQAPSDTPPHPKYLLATLHPRLPPAHTAPHTLCRQEAEAEWRAAEEQGLDPEEEGADAGQGLHQHTRGHKIHGAQAQEGCLGRRLRYGAVYGTVRTRWRAVSSSQAGRESCRGAPHTLLMVGLVRA